MRGFEETILETCRAEKSAGRAWSDPIRKGFQDAKDEFRRLHQEGRSLSACRRFSRAMDSLIRVIYSQALDDIPEAEGHVAVLAMGGYGRAQMSPGSDVDIRFLVSEGKGGIPGRELVTSMVQVLWSLPFQTGQGCDTAKGTLRQMAAGEINIFTSALESRVIAGSPEIYIPFREGILSLMRANRKDFARRVIAQRNKRLAQYGFSLHIKEPNVKETAGGLRDYHTARWLLYLLHDIPLGSRSDLPALVSKDDWMSLKQGLAFLTRVRNEMHFESVKRDDRLGLDIQKSVAEAFGYERSEVSLPVEKFMRDYYRHAKAIHRVSTFLIEQAVYGIAPRGVPLSMGGKVLGIEKEGLLFLPKGAQGLDPDSGLALFVLAAEKGLRMSEQAKKEIRGIVRGAGPALGTQVELLESFRKLAGSPKGFAQALRDLHDTDILSRILPEFEGLDCFTQFDQYHHYTADEHTFHVVENMEHLREESSPEMRPYQELLGQIGHFRALQMGLVFHDIAKWKKGDHSLVGAQMALEALPRLGFTKEEADLVAFLARQHLVMANLFQRRDVTEGSVASKLAETAGDIERLRLLTLLTFADIKAVGPGVWSPWKAQVLMDLHRRTEAVLGRAPEGEGVAAGRVEKLRVETERILAQELGPEKASALAADHFRLMPERYFSSQNPAEIASHAKVLSSFEEGPLKTAWTKRGRYVELQVVLRDALGVFSALSGCLSAHGLSILNCEAYVRRDGLVLDLFDLDTEGLGATVEENLSGFERDLAGVLAQAVRVQDLIGAREQSRISGSRHRVKIETRISFDDESSGEFTVLDIQAQDFLGLLHLISSELACLGLDIGFARVTTQADRAVDAFYIREKSGGKIAGKDRKEKIRKALESAIASRSSALETV